MDVRERLLQLPHPEKLPVQKYLIELDRLLRDILASLVSSGSFDYLHDHHGGDGAPIRHGYTTGLGNDDHWQYALLAGRVGGQTLHGGVQESDSLKLAGNSATTGYVEVLRELRIVSASDPGKAYCITFNDALGSLDIIYHED